MLITLLLTEIQLVIKRTLDQSSCEPSVQSDDSFTNQTEREPVRLTFFHEREDSNSDKKRRADRQRMDAEGSAAKEARADEEHPKP